MPRKIREMDDIEWKSGEEGRMNIYIREEEIVTMIDYVVAKRNMRKQQKKLEK